MSFHQRSSRKPACESDNSTDTATVASTVADIPLSHKASDIHTVSDTTLAPPSLPLSHSLAQTKLYYQQPQRQHPPSSIPTDTAPKYSGAAATAGTNSVNVMASGTQVSETSIYPSEPPTGTPRCIVRIDRDHNLADEATRFECEQFPEEFLGRVTRPQFKGTVEGINECMKNAEQSLLNCLDTLLDCLSAYTAKHCFGTHYQRALHRMEAFIDDENHRLYHPARMHLRDPQKVGMLYLEFEIY